MLAAETRAAEIFAYVERITHAAGLPAITISHDGRVEEVTA
jgi:poly-gamma-glutamate synthesis protein (capsule biosynthesis protein)